MVVCKFFQQGYCRYGQNCRFEHIYGSKYSYHAPVNPPAQTPQVPVATVVTDEQLVHQVQCDIQAALKGGQWILSCYAPYKEKPGFPGLTDLSPEEARLFIYEAKAKNAVDQAVYYMDSLYKETRNKYEQLLNPTLNTMKVLRSLFKGETVSQAPLVQTSAFGAANSASSIFRSALNNTPMTQNSNTVSIFNQNPNKSIFGDQGADNAAARSIFAQANKSSFGTATPSVFQTNASETPKSIFAQENQKLFGITQAASSNPSSIFASASQSIFGQSNDPFGQNAFAATGSVFQKPSQQDPGQQNGFAAANNIFQQNSSDTGDNVYSKLEDLSQEDIEAFESSDFKLGFVPELPPPLSLCS
ncbi:unnamed protein product, partial [Iphiclides podalirius]